MPSSVIATFVYNPETSRLRVVFVSGMVYDYKNVPASVYEAMRKSGSKGTFLNKEIKGKYKFEKIK
jgi:hypothetical protein